PPISLHSFPTRRSSDLGHELPRLTQLVFRNTEGNPFFIGEVLRHLSETGTLEQLELQTRRPVDELGLPEGVKEVVGRRLARLSEDRKSTRLNSSHQIIW